MSSKSSSSSNSSPGSSTFRLSVGLPRRVEVRPLKEVSGVNPQRMERDDFCAWIGTQLTGQGLLGIHEGTLLTADAAEQGLETESWTVDAGEAPRGRDWIGGQALVQAEFYFDSRENAERARKRLERMTDVRVGGIEEQRAEDWDAQWKASFLANPGGVRVPPSWRILPPWVDAADAGVGADETILRINPGAGFGTGTHETTQLCLTAIAEAAGRRPLEGRPVLDFGSGSGILSIGAALRGGRVDAIEIDPLANENALENARINGVEDRLMVDTSLDACRETAYDLVIANILKPVLLEFADRLVARIAPGGGLILSGLIAADVAPVTERYSPLLGGRRPDLRELNEWRCLVWA